MTRMHLALPIALAGCGPRVGGAFYDLVAEGVGDDLVSSIPHADQSCVTRLYVEGERAGESVRACFDGEVELAGETLQCMVFPDTVGFHQYTDDAMLFWGDSTGGLWPSPTVMLSFPLREGRVWTTGLHVQPERMQYEVVGVEAVDTPAGVFEAVRVDELDTNDMTLVSDWVVEDVGVVQRVSWYTEPPNWWVLLAWSHPGEAP